MEESSRKRSLGEIEEIEDSFGSEKENTPTNSPDTLNLTKNKRTSSTIESIYNYIITTDARKEYLIGLKDYSSNSHTGKFLTNKISNIVEKLGLDKFAAIVTDAASNCNLACQKIQKMYLHIWNVRYAAHVVNLIASNLVKLDNLKS
ncbi:1074_t:CDS:2 [Gigaspora margarita]|uniref:1074_t:CDS:1 n=1 Tax=Gigaspora margarita TaxID=4874 RepID=A0ABN7VDG5_GIGMA|nr:1074_t:CDS:2 [Gigaspora margarita]